MKLLSRLFGRASAREAEVEALGPTALATIYERAGQYFIEASDRTRWAEAGFWVSSGEIRVLDAAVPDEVLGDAILVALAKSRIEVPVPPREANQEAALFRAMRVRSRLAAMQGTRACVLTREPPEGALRVEPQQNGGTAGSERGYRPMAQAAVVLPPASSATELGRSARAALAQALQHQQE